MKCLFSQKKLKLSGLAFSKDGMHPDSIQFTEIQCQLLRIQKHCKAFSGSWLTSNVSYHSTAPFHTLWHLHKNFKSLWTNTCQTALDSLKYAVTLQSCVGYFSTNKEATIYTDTNWRGIPAVYHKTHQIRRTTSLFYILHTHFIHFTPTKRALFPNCEIMICSSVCLWKQQTFPL